MMPRTCLGAALVAVVSFSQASAQEAAADRAVCVEAGATVYRTATGEGVGVDVELEFGRVFRVQAKERGRALLVAGVDELGWVDTGALLAGRSKALDLLRFRAAIDVVGPRGDEGLRRARSMTPATGNDLRYRRVPVKVVSHPAVKIPVYRGENIDAEPLARFAFYYVYAVRSRAGRVEFLIGGASRLEARDEKVAELVGWVAGDDLVFWATRAGVAIDTDAAAVAARRAANRPVKLFGALPGERGDDGVPNPVFVEDLAKRPGVLVGPLGRSAASEQLNLPVLDRFDRSAGAEGAILKLCMPVEVDSDGEPIPATGAQLEDAIRSMRTFELVFVLDCTGSMERVFSPLKAAVLEVVERLRALEQLHTAELERLRIRVAVVGYKDAQDTDSFVLTDSERFFRLSTGGSAERKSFADYMDSLKSSGGDDHEELPFAGVERAVGKFLGPESLEHVDGAATMIVLMGDAGNHPEGTPQSRQGPAIGDVRAMLGRVPGGQAVARITLHTAFVADSRKEKCETWDQQMPGLAAYTGGEFYRLQISRQRGRLLAEDREDAVERMVALIGEVIDTRRSLLRSQIEGWYGGGQTSAAQLARMQLAEVISPADAERLRQQKIESLTAVVRGSLELDGVTVPPFKTRVLLTVRELLRLQATVNELETRLDTAAATIEADGLDEQRMAAVYRRAIVATMLAVFGELGGQDGEQRIEDWESISMGAIQDRIGTLPVRIRALERDYPRSMAEYGQLGSDLRRANARLMDLVLSPSRMFEPAIGFGEKHIWIDVTDLP